MRVEKDKPSRGKGCMAILLDHMRRVLFYSSNSLQHIRIFQLVVVLALNVILAWFFEASSWYGAGQSDASLNVSESDTRRIATGFQLSAIGSNCFLALGSLLLLFAILLAYIQLCYANENLFRRCDCLHAQLRVDDAHRVSKGYC